jgi:hypothetical protein
MTSSVFLDVNVWLALSSPDHEHFPSAWSWYTALPNSTRLVFCRFTQIAFLRLLTTAAVMGPGTLTQEKAWHAYDRWLRDAAALFASEPPGLDPVFRSLASAASVSPKTWADAYLAAFAQTASLTLVTFDRALAGKASDSILLS